MRFRAFLAAAVAALTVTAGAVAATGGTYATPSGETVRVLASDAYPADDARNQAFADYLGSLLHGSELSSVTLYLAPPEEVRALCGRQALACYDRARGLIVAPAEDYEGGPTARALIAHEYGHHVAAWRRNDPWDAADWGPKRWASAAGVCARDREGTAFPGAADARYPLNPGEAFAEVYRLLNERRAGVPESPWQVVSPSWYPDEEDLRAAEEDVTVPWQGPSRSVFRSALRPGKSRYRLTVATPYDGRLVLRLRAPRTGAFELRLYQGGKLRAASRTAIALTVCGERAFLASVVRLRGRGSVSVEVERP